MGETDAIGQIHAVLDELHAAAARSDGQAYFDLFAADAVFIGTDVEERWPLPEFKARSLPVFAAKRGWIYTLRSRHVTVAPRRFGPVGWFDEVLNSASWGTSRGSGVLRLEPGGWKIAQYVLAHPIPNAVGDEVLDMIKAFEKNQARQPGGR